MKQFISFIKSLFTIRKKTQSSQEKQHTEAAHSAKPDPEKTQKPVQAAKEGAQEKTKNKVYESKWSVNNFPVPPQKDKTRFHDLNLPVSVMHAIADLDFKYCTPIQTELLPHTLEGKDATAKAQTGTGKSASFIITMLTAFIRKPGKNKKGCPRALILAPTRELVHQIEKDFMDLAKYTPIKIIAIYGGTGYQKQQDLLKQKPVDVIVATPGRLIDFMNKRLIDPSKVEIAVIDEADRMLDMGFVPDVRKIILKTPHKNNRQTLFFSATLSPEVLRLAESWTTDNVVRIEIAPEQTAADSINQIVYITTENDKFKNVYNLINNEQLQRVIIFVNRKDTSRFLSEKFLRYGQKCSILSGDIAQDKRFKVLNDFKDGKINILIATDVAARGLHIESISHVINYDLPQEPEHYIHRIGRTGRAGALGTSISFADETSSFFIPKIEEVLGNKIICEYPSEELDKALPKPKPRVPIKKKASDPGSGTQTRTKKPYKKRRQPAKATPTKKKNAEP